MRMPSPELKCARGASSGTPSPPGPKCSRIIAALAWKPPQARIAASAGSVSPETSRTPAIAPFVGDQRIGGAAKRNDDASVARGAGQLAVDGLAAADRLDARRAFGEIIDRLVERHAVARRSISPWRARARASVAK